MSDSSRHALYAIAEVTYGVTPAVTPAFKAIRHTGTNLGLSKSTVISEELRPDRQITDFRHGTKQTGGDLMTELSYGSFDDFLEATLCGTWAAKAAPYVANTISAAAADNSINDSANLLPVLLPGDKVTISGFTGAGTTANQAKLEVVTSTVSKMVLKVDGTHIAFINDASGEAVTVTTLTNQLKAGIVRRSFTVLRDFSDLTTAGQNRYHLFTGCEMNKLSLTVAVNAIVKAIFSVIGQDFPTPSDTAPAGWTQVAANSNLPMDSFSGLIYDGANVLAVVSEVSLGIENGLAAKFVVGSAVTIRPSIGRSNASGQVTAYFEDATLLKKFINETESSLLFYLADLAGNKYRVTLPRIKYNGGQPDTQGQGPITIALPIQALLDSVTGTNIIIDRIAA